MKEDKLISVIIPAYNHDKYIDKTIKSIINQSYENIELIIIDDGSPDDTWKVIQSFQAECTNRFKRVIFETQTNHGTCYTLNKLISYAKGDYIYLIASDDAAKENALKMEYDFLEQHPDYVLAVGDNEFIDAEGERIGWDMESNSVPLAQAEYKTFAENLNIRELGDMFGDYRLLSKGNHVPNGYLIRGETLREIPPFTSEAPLEDFYMQMQLAKAGKMKFMDEILFSYRWHGKNTIKQADKIAEYLRKTICHEEILVHKMADKKWERIFMSSHGHKKILFDLKGIVFYKISLYILRHFYVKILGMDFHLFSMKR